MKSAGFALAATLSVASLTAPLRAAERAGYRIVWDDFQTPWNEDTKWLPFSPAPSYVADDALVTTSAHGLFARSRGENAWTGEPAFVNTLGQGAGWLSPFDHAKWIVMMNHTSSRNVVGFDAVPGMELSCEARVTGQVYGGDGQPFGDAVKSPNGDLRLGVAAISAFDPETFAIFNFLLTNEAVYAFYERPAFARPPGDRFAAFEFAVPVLPRRPWDVHDLRIAYDPSRGTVRWLVEGVEVLRVDAIGARIDRKFLLVDHGGTDEIVAPAQLDCAMAMFDFLDGYGPEGEGLVQIEADSDDYFDPPLGEPSPMRFVDPDSSLSMRLFGQGASIEVERFVVESRPARGE